jgi:GAF domain-containing protein
VTISAATELRWPAARSRDRVARRQQAPLRFLFIGNGIDHGWGAASRRSAPTLALAKAVRDITGAPCEVDLIGTATTTGADALDRLRRSPTVYDGAVVAIGSHDALRLLPVADWGTRLLDLVSAVQAALPEGAPLVLVGVPNVHVPDRVRPLNPLAQRHATRLDRVAQRLADVRATVHYLPAPSLGRLVGRRAGADLTVSYTLPIAAALAAAIRTPAAVLQGSRYDLRAVLSTERSDDLPELAGIARRAAAEFAVDEAAISLFHGPLRGRVSSRGPELAAARPFGYCEVVLCTGEALVVTDGGADPRFTADPFPDALRTPFYAGVPIHGADGTVIGAMCLIRDEPDAAHAVDLDRLRDYALEAAAAIRASR